jgi:hypothetical protein
MCVDVSRVVWPYLLKNDDTDGIVAPANVESIRAEYVGVVAPLASDAGGKASSTS